MRIICNITQRPDVGFDLAPTAPQPRDSANFHTWNPTETTARCPSMRPTASDMAFPNVYTHRKVAETKLKACDICYKLSSSVLITPDNKVCPPLIVPQPGDHTAGN